MQGSRGRLPYLSWPRSWSLGAKNAVLPRELRRGCVWPFHTHTDTHTQSPCCPPWSLPSPEFPCNILVPSCHRTRSLLWGLSEVEEKMGWRQSLQGADVPMGRTIYLNEPLRNAFCENSIRWEDCGGRRRGRRKEAVVFSAINNTVCGCSRLEQHSWTCRNSLQRIGFVSTSPSRLLEVALCSDLSPFTGTHPPAESALAKPLARERGESPRQGSHPPTSPTGEWALARKSSASWGIHWAEYWNSAEAV